MQVDSLPFIVAGLLGIATTHLTDFWTKSSAPDWLKSFINLALATLAGCLTTITWSTGQTWKDYLAAIGSAWVVSLATHYADPFKTVATVQANTSEFGIGGSSVPAPNDRPTTSGRL